MKPRVEIVTPIESDVELVYGAPYTFPFALMILRGDDILGFGGMFFFDDKVALFADMSKEVYAYPVSIVRVAKRLLQKAVETGRDVVTLPEDRPEAVRLLEHLGFRERSDGWHSLSR